MRTPNNSPIRDHRRGDTQHAHVANGAASQQAPELQAQHAGGISLSPIRDQRHNDTQTKPVANAAAGLIHDELQHSPAGGGTLLDDLLDQIEEAHRERRYAMKLQQKIDRALEAFVRHGFTEWRFDMPAAERERQNKEALRLITAARKGGGPPRLIGHVAATDKSRAPTDEMRKKAEKVLAKLALQLPAWRWVEGVRGAGALGLATIIAETGDLSNYPGPAHVWSRLGYAPYDGCAGSTWKRESWRPRALTKQEWTERPFSGERYALTYSIADSLFRAQWQSAQKAGGDVGKPTGPFGQVYADRKAHTGVTHPEWSKQHAHQDALRVMMKCFLKQLWSEWRKPTT